MDNLRTMIGKTVTVDGCSVGRVMEMTVTGSYGVAPRLTIELVVDEEAVAKLREYAVNAFGER